jgi:membrane protein YqaA with SNARE-associated domain
MTTPESLRVLASVHGVVGWIAAAALATVAGLVLARGWQRKTELLAAAATLAATVGAALGFALEPAFDERLRQRLFAHSASLGWLFERKLHAATVAVLLTWGALWLLLALHRARAPRLRTELGRAATAGFVASAVLIVFASVAASVVARSARF